MAKAINKSDNLIKSKHTAARIAPRKVVLVANAIRGMELTKAIKFLTFNNQKASDIIKSVVESAVANGIHNFGLEKEGMFIADVQVGPGPIRKGGRFAAKGTFKPIWKHTTHITVLLGSKGGKAKVKEETK